MYTKLHQNGLENNKVMEEIRKIIINRKLHEELSYFHQIGKEPLISITLGTLLERSARKHGDKEAVKSVHQNKGLSYYEVLEECDKFAAALRDLKINPGDRVGIWATNSLEWYISMFACARAGVLFATINPNYQPPELEYCLNKVGVKALITDYKDKFKNYYESIAELAPEIRNSEPGKIKSSRLPFLESVIVIGDQELKGTFNFSKLIDKHDPTTCKIIKQNQHLIDPDQGFNIQFTSGTTGKSKGALVSHSTMVNNSLQIATRADIIDQDHRFSIQPPLFHAMGTVVGLPTALHAGATAVIPGPSFKGHSSLEAIKNENCTIISGTPTMYVDLVAAEEERNLGISAELAFTGGSSCPPKLFEQMQSVLNIKRQQSLYGLTEVTAVVFQSLPNDDREKVLTTVGHVGDHLEAKVVDDKGMMVPFGTPGELCLRGYPVMLGYWNDEEKTREIMGADRWIKTGDIFILEKNGYGKIVGRCKDMIIRGGENIFPKEIEDLLITHPKILDVTVIGVPDDRLGEEVLACIRPKNNGVLTEKDIYEFCTGKLAHYKIPKKIIIVDDFPKTASGKIQKFKLREMYSRD